MKDADPLKQALQPLEMGRNDVFLNSKHLGDSDVEKLCKEEVPHERIHKLHLFVNKITSEGVSLLALTQWDNLTFLSLHSNLINAKGCKYITRANLKSLTSLNVSNNQLGSEGALHISKGAWPKLDDLQIRKVKKGSAGVASLVRSNWGKLEQLDMGESIFNVNEGTLKDEQTFDLLLSEYNAIKTVFINRFPCQNLVESNERNAPKIYYKLKEKFRNAKLKM